MTRTGIVSLIGAVVTAIGIFLCVRASELATTWQPTESGNGWGGRTDPAMQQTYFTLGLVGLCFGLILLAIASWAWMTSAATTTQRPSIEM
jgi:hypothetical protein